MIERGQSRTLGEMGTVEKNRTVFGRGLKSPAVDSNGRDVWPLLHRNLREMKWDKRRRMEYRLLVFGSMGRMFGFVALMVVLIAGPLAYAWVSLLQGSVLTVVRGAKGGVLRLLASQAMFMVVALCVSLAANWWHLRRSASSRIVPALLAQRRCGACMYDLDSAAVDGAGCTVCPECGSAWRLPPS